MRFLALPVVAALMATSAEAINKDAPPRVDPTLTEGWLWKNLLKSSEIAAFDGSCEAVKQFKMYEYSLHELMEPAPRGLKQWAGGLKKLFSQREYPGGWSGYDRHGYDRAVLRMDYTDVPLAVREWIEEQERTDGPGKGYFGVFEKPKSDDDDVDDVVAVPSASEVDRSQDENRVAIFAPGVIYHTLPLWAAEGSECKDDLLDLTKYKPEVAEGNVVGWAEHKSPGFDNKAEFKVTARALKAKTKSTAEKEAKSAEGKEEL
ncbi:hypothetical protein V2G26_003571 [Clonostachys chloroleuca]|uniref:Uncharacterized protein n=1 Tax=Clonostachys chloroleuca TaxID=1926264 RepID=A0AA35LYH2_9HYPO|nr:unnamed protein product [Clonostachys chloroleuca]